MSSDEKKKVVNSHGRDIIYNVYKFMQEEKYRNELKIPLNRLKDRVAESTGVGQSTIKRIVNEASHIGEGEKFRSPRQNMTRREKTYVVADKFEVEIVRNIIYSYLVTRKQQLTMKQLFHEMKKEDAANFKRTLSSFRHIVHRLGFQWKKTQNNIKTLVEKSEIRVKRVNYLNKLKEYREEGRDIIYCGETYLHTTSKTCDDGSDNHLETSIVEEQSVKIRQPETSIRFVPNEAPVTKGESLLMRQLVSSKDFVPNKATVAKGESLPISQHGSSKNCVPHEAPAAKEQSLLMLHLESSKGFRKRGSSNECVFNEAPLAKRQNLHLESPKKFVPNEAPVAKEQSLLICQPGSSRSFVPPALVAKGQSLLRLHLESPKGFIPSQASILKRQSPIICQPGLSKDFVSNEAIVAKGHSVIIHYAGSLKGFVPNTLNVFKSDLKTGDYRVYNTDANFTKWLIEKFIPNVKQNSSALVLDNISYYNALPVADPAPSRKYEMQKWLSEKSISFELKETKPELYCKIQFHRSADKTDEIDRILSQHGIPVLRLPPNHPELNPIKKIWTLVKNHVAASSVTFKPTDVWPLAREKLNEISSLEWQNICASVERLEKEYMEREYALNDIEDVTVSINADCGSKGSSDEEVDLKCEPPDL